jgi:hypothetical protein
MEKAVPVQATDQAGPQDDYPEEPRIDAEDKRERNADQGSREEKPQQEVETIAGRFATAPARAR